MREGKSSESRGENQRKKKGAFRRFGGHKRQPYRKAPKRSNLLNQRNRNRSIGNNANNVRTASRQAQAPVPKARLKVNAENTRNKYSGVQFPKLYLFPQLHKPSVSPDMRKVQNFPRTRFWDI